MKKILPQLIIIFAITLAIFSFLPVTLSESVYKPTLLGLPRTLWIGIFISLGFIVLTVIGTKVFFAKEREEE